MSDLICLTGVLPDPRPVLEETPLMYDFPDAIKRNGEVWELAQFIPEWILTVSGEVQIDDFTPAVDLDSLSFATPPPEILGRRSLLHDFFRGASGLIFFGRIPSRTRLVLSFFVRDLAFRFRRKRVSSFAFLVENVWGIGEVSAFLTVLETASGFIECSVGGAAFIFFSHTPRGCRAVPGFASGTWFFTRVRAQPDTISVEEHPHVRYAVHCLDRDRLVRSRFRSDLPHHAVDHAA